MRRKWKICSFSCSAITACVSRSLQHKQLLRWQKILSAEMLSANLVVTFQIFALISCKTDASVDFPLFHFVCTIVQ